MGQAGLTQSGWAVKKDMVEGLPPTMSSGNGYLEVFLGLILADKIGKRPGSETCIEGSVLSTGLTRYDTDYFVSPP